MSITKEESLRNEALKNVAIRMMMAARTAPKSRGIDNLEIAIVEGETIHALSKKMKEIFLSTGQHFFERDSENILNSPVIVLLGTKITPINLVKCGMCGFVNCIAKNKEAGHPCAFNTVDLGIAMGSAVSIAADCRVDCRVMFSVGQAALQLQLLGNDVKIVYGIPLSATGKNPFFDRKPV